MISALINGIASLGSAGINYAAGRQQAEDNYWYNEKAADNADKRTRNLYTDLYSPEAKVKQYEDAGLNPALMYSMGGASGTTSTQGAMGAGNAGMPNQMHLDLQSALMAAQQIELLKAQKENTEADTEKKRNDAADDPVVSRYMAELQQSIQNANKTESEQINSAYNSLISAMVNTGYYSENMNFSISHSEGESGSEGSGYTISFTDAHGDQKSFNVGGSVSANVGLTNGGSVSANYGQSNGHNESHGESHGENNSTSWAKNVADAIATGSGKSGNKRELFQLLQKFAEQAEDAQYYGKETRDAARRTYEKRVERYESNRKRK